MLEMELQSAMKNNTVIVLDMGSSHSQNEIQTLNPPTAYYTRINRISALTDGLNIPLLKPFMQRDSEQESNLKIVSAATNALSQPLNLGVAQTAVLRESIIFALDRLEDYDTEIDAIVAGLNRKGRQGYEVCSRFWEIFNCRALGCKNKKEIENGKINIISLNDFENDAQKVLAEIILSFLWRKVHDTSSSLKYTYDIFLDECQRFTFSKSAVICQLLREGRKFNINLILSTQTLSCYNKETLSILDQAATKLYFRMAQDDVNKAAKKISPADWQLWKTRLTNLNVGECIASGIFNINGQEITRPLLLK